MVSWWLVALVGGLYSLAEVATSPMRRIPKADLLRKRNIGSQPLVSSRAFQPSARVGDPRAEPPLSHCFDFATPTCLHYGPPRLLFQTTGESRVNDAVKSGENLDEFAGMKEVVRFLLKRFPTGDYTGQYPESDYDEAGSDSDEDDELAAAVVGATSRVNQARRRSRRGGGSDGEYNSEEDEDEDDTLDGFIVGDHVEESDSGSEYESDVDDGECGELNGRHLLSLAAPPRDTLPTLCG